MMAAQIEAPLLRVDGLVKHFPVGGRLFSRATGVVRAVDGVSFELGRGQTFGIVGESGCGKSTLARTLLRLETPDAGRVTFDGIDVFTPEAMADKSLRRRIGVVFQDPYAAFSPRMTIHDILTEPLKIHRGILPPEAWPARVRELLGRVGLRPEFAERYPHEFSGGQLQRIGMARALVLEPDLIILDEPVSALDVSIQAQVVNLLEDLQTQLGISYICISHDLSIIRHISDWIAVMYLGQIVEMGPCEEVYANPAHPYTKALLSAETRIDLDGAGAGRITLGGEVPSPLNPPSGCRFRNRCWMAADRCAQDPPVAAHGARISRCHFPLAFPSTEASSA
jgi:oligopeptide/dipeptide ABC transporter ATP-binding protein